MTLRHIKIFVSLCNNGYNTTKTAETMHMTQPAVSLAVKELEQYYGVGLFDRLGRRLQITEAGRRFLEYAVHISTLFDDMEKGMRNWDYFGLLRVGASIAIGSHFLPGYVKAFTHNHPGTEVRALVASSETLEGKILTNELDLALIEGVANSPDIVSEEYMEDHLAVICPVNGTFRQGQQISIEEFRRQKFLLREHGSGTREVFDRATESAGFSVTPIWEAMSTTALVNAVINGLGIAILPRRMVLGPLRNGSVVAISVKGLNFRRSFRIIYHKDKLLTASAKDFIELCRNYEADYPMPIHHGLF